MNVEIMRHKDNNGTASKDLKSLILKNSKNLGIDDLLNEYSKANQEFQNILKLNDPVYFCNKLELFCLKYDMELDTIRKKIP